MTVRTASCRYGIRPRAVHAAIGSGELFVALGARRSSVHVDFRPGGTFTTSVVSGSYADVRPDAVDLVLSTGGRVRLTVRGTGSTAELTAVFDGLDDETTARWQAAFRRLAPPPGRLDAEADERQTYDDWLDFYRSVIPGKLSGLSADDARRSLVGSRTTLLGLAKHLTGVERYWFQIVVEGRSAAEVGPNHRGGAESWELTPDDTVETVLAAYADACAESRRIAVRHELTDTATTPHAGEISVRMVYTHMIEEIARHAGHADILRELIDGTTGVNPAG
ncbi:DinB family protein [Planosporangium sp. 12N6]|uniref:DinB family protein n=1 Tax=Planosporangium spinosum TaxID=3402278 RepID=UPI003CEA0FA9